MLSSVTSKPAASKDNDSALRVLGSELAYLGGVVVYHNRGTVPALGRWGFLMNTRGTSIRPLDGGAARWQMEVETACILHWGVELRFVVMPHVYISEGLRS